MDVLIKIGVFLTSYIFKINFNVAILEPMKDKIPIVSVLIDMDILSTLSYFYRQFG